MVLILGVVFLFYVIDLVLMMGYFVEILLSLYVNMGRLKMLDVLKTIFSFTQFICLFMTLVCG